MRGFSFESFVLSDANRDAFEAAREVAAVSWAGARPVVLWGPAGCGKSHLLWSIVKAVRAGEQRAGLALVLAREFPQKVRDLAANPAPIRRGAPAILLVDELEDFQADAPDLEAVVRTFLEEGHQVVLASHIHPDHLANLGSPFRALLAEGAVIEMGPVAGAGVRPEQRLNQAEEALEALRAERDQLERQLAEKAAQAAEAALLRTSLANAEAELETLREAYETLRQRQPEAPEYAPELARLQETVTRLQADFAAASAERDTLEQRLAERAGVKQALEETRISLANAQAEAEAAQAEKAAVAEEVSALATRCTALQDAAQERDTLRARVETATERLDALSARWEEMEAACMGDLTRLTDRALAIAATALEQAEAAPADNVSEALEHELAAARGRMAELEQALEDAQLRHLEGEQAWRSDVEELERKLEEQGAHGEELDKARRQLALMTAEMEALRHEAATQVARANLQAGELEGRMASLEAVLHYRQETARKLSADAGGLAATLAGAVEPLEALARSLRQNAEPPQWETGSSTSPGDEDQWLEQQAFFFPADDAAAAEDPPPSYEEVDGTPDEAAS